MEERKDERYKQKGSLKLKTKLFPQEILLKIKNTNILVVGAGGIGCELLKNLCLASFQNITLVILLYKQFSRLILIQLMLVT
jgi:molybdopterin/thiamine biosynthesis adenylyltransferase